MSKIINSNNIKYILVILTIFYTTSTFAQNNTSSPYSMYGLGDLKTQSNPHNSAMGNTGIGMASENFINVLNPASLTGIDSMTFIFEIGTDGNVTSYETKTKSASSNDFNFSYISLGWRITPWLSSSFGLNPYSSVGYEINSSSLIEGIQQEYPLNIIGSGDISRAYLAFGLMPVKNLSVGIKSSFLFGSTIQTQDHDLSDLGSNSIYNVTTDYFHNFYWEFGLQYQLKLKNDILVLGAIYNPRQTLVTSRENTTSDSAGSTLQYERESEGDFVIPEEFGLGFSYKKNNKYLIAMDAGIQMWSDESYKISGVDLKNNPYLSLGIDLLPVENHIAKYYKRMNYRLGFKYEQSYLSMRGTQLDEFGFSFGVGLPLKKSKSRLDLSFEAGQMGTTTSRLIQEKYFRFRLGFSLKDTWFIRRKFD